MNFIALLLLSSAALTLALGRSIPGVHFPLPITPAVRIPDSRWLLSVYEIVLDRKFDSVGFAANFNALQAGAARVDVFHSFTTSSEFRNATRLCDRAGFVERYVGVFIFLFIFTRF